MNKYALFLLVVSFLFLPLSAQVKKDSTSIPEKVIVHKELEKQQAEKDSLE